MANDATSVGEGTRTIKTRGQQGPTASSSLSRMRRQTWPAERKNPFFKQNLEFPVQKSFSYRILTTDLIVVRPCATRVQLRRRSAARVGDRGDPPLARRLRRRRRGLLGIVQRVDGLARGAVLRPHVAPPAAIATRSCCSPSPRLQWRGLPGRRVCSTPRPKT